jgi:hypothetical protein
MYVSDTFIKKFKLDKKIKANASDVAIPFLFVGLHALSRNAFSESVLPYFFISIFLLGMGIAGFMAYIYEEIDYKKFLKLFWRMTFVMTLFLYSILIIANVFAG